MPFTFSTSSARGNPLLAIRFVFLGFLILLSIFVLIFAILNLQTFTSAGLQASISTVVFFINAILTLIFVGLGVVDFAVPQKNVLPLWSECTFSGIIACLHTGTSIGATAQAATICKLDIMEKQCASDILLLPVGWLSSAVFLIHFIAVTVLTASRSSQEPDIWLSSMCSRAHTQQELPDNASSMTIVPEGDIEAPPETKREPEPIAPWANEQEQVRRGRDAPFKLPTPRSTPAPTPRSTLMGTPAVKPQGLPQNTGLVNQGLPQATGVITQGAPQVPHVPQPPVAFQGLPLHPRASISTQGSSRPPRASVSPLAPRASTPAQPRAPVFGQGLPSNPRVSTPPLPRALAQGLPSNPRALSPDLPQPPSRVHFRSESAEGRPIRPNHSPAGSQGSIAMSVESFPARVRNSNAPIPLPDRSQWVRADPTVPIYSRFATTRLNP